MKAQIYETTDYDKFKFIEENRKIDPNHVKRIQRMMEVDDDLHLHPIIVNSQMEISDGQHRFLAAKEMERPIFYVVDDSYDSRKLIAINTCQKKWEFADYLKYWCDQGYEEYIKLNEFCKKVNLGLRAVFSWTSHGTGNIQDKATTSDFKHGLYRFIISEDEVIALQHASKFIQILKERNFRPETFDRQLQFHKALKEFFTSRFVLPEIFFERLSNGKFAFYYMKSYGEYLDQLAYIYNYHRRENKLQVVKKGLQASVELKDNVECF
jgi:hypothetical protein